MWISGKATQGGNIEKFDQSSGKSFHLIEQVCCASGSQIVDPPVYGEPKYTVSDLPVPGICGTQSLKDRVLNGENTTISDYPW